MSMKACGLVVVSVLFCGLVAPGQARPSTPDAGTLSGNVLYAFDNSPLPRAYVLVHSCYGYGDKVVKLDDGARYEVSLEPGFYDVFVAAPGYVPTCKKVVIVKGRTTQFTPKLQPDFEHMVAN
jgi:PEGA domain